VRGSPGRITRDPGLDDAAPLDPPVDAVVPCPAPSRSPPGRWSSPRSPTARAGSSGRCAPGTPTSWPPACAPSACGSRRTAPTGWSHPQPLRGPAEVDAGLAGTVLRFLPPVAALATGPVRVDGDPRLRERPNAGLLAALRDLGVEVDDGGRGRAPFTVHGTGRCRRRGPVDAERVLADRLRAAAGRGPLRRGARPGAGRRRPVDAARRDDGDDAARARRRRDRDRPRGWRVSPGPIAALDR
jgi:hypothetical protein